MDFFGAVAPLANACETTAVYLAGQNLQDRRLADQVKQAVDSTGYKALGAAQVIVRGQLVILKGRVPSYFLKQLAQAVAMKVAGVRELRNEVQVVPC